MTRKKLAPLLVLAALSTFPSAAGAQASRTFISGTGDDQAACSRHAPCKTFMGAYNNTAAGGEITVLDAGGYGMLSIGKSLTVSGYGSATTVLAAGANGVVVNAGATDRVTFRNLRFNGLRTGVDGVRIVQAGMVRIDESIIQGFTTGIKMIPTTGQARLSVSDTRIHHNSGAGVLVSPTGASIARATIKRSDVDDNADGIVAIGTNGRAAVNLLRSEVTDSGSPGTAATGIGLRAVGSNGLFRLTSNDVIGNLVGLKAESNGKFFSAGDNFVTGNVDDGAMPTPAPKS